MCMFILISLLFATAVSAHPDEWEPGFAPPPPSGPMLVPPLPTPDIRRPQERDCLTVRTAPCNMSLPAGYLRIGAGYSPLEGFLGKFSVGHTGLFEQSGAHIAFNGQISSMAHRFELLLQGLSTQRPWFWQAKGFHHGISLLNDETSPIGNSTGGSLDVGYRWGHEWRLSLGYRFAYQSMEQTETLHALPWAPAGDTWDTPTILSTTRITLRYNSWLRRMYHLPEGTRFQIRVEGSHGWLGSDYRYTKADGHISYGLRLPLGLHINARAGGGIFLAPSAQDVPVFDRYRFLSSQGPGLTMFGLGPRVSDGQQDMPVGGTGMLYGQLNLHIPLFQPIVKLYLFGGVEAGALFDGLGHQRQAYWNVAPTAGLLWMSPLGPMRLGMAFPLHDQPYQPASPMLLFSLGHRF